MQRNDICDTFILRSRSQDTSKNCFITTKPKQMRQLIIILCLLPTVILAQTIQGPITTCNGNCETYTIQSNTSGPFVWNISDVESENIVGESLDICWSNTSTHTIAVSDLSATPGEHLSLIHI